MPMWMAAIIATLILTFIYRYMKEMVEQGLCLYRATSLYLVKRGKEHPMRGMKSSGRLWVEKLGGGKEDSVTVQAV